MSNGETLTAPNSSVFKWLNIALFVSVVIEVGLLADQLMSINNDRLVGSAQQAFHVASLALLVIIVGLRHVHHVKVMKRAEASERQMKAMLSMFSIVRHDLNNDMQVVVGNAELAQLIIETGGDLRKPVSNITAAATLAIDRIEQLSVFNTSGHSSRTAIDLNAMLRECMAKLSSEISAIVTLRLELEHLPIRVVADQYLLGLTLSHLIRQTVKTMQHGGEIVVRTQDLNRSQAKVGSPVVNLEIFVVRALATANKSSVSSIDKQQDAYLTQRLSTIKALVERSGAVMVEHSKASSGSLINMGFVSMPVPEPVKKSIRPVLDESFG